MIKLYNKQSSFHERLKRAFLFLKGQTIHSTLAIAFRAFQKMLFGWNLYTTLYDFPLKKYIDFTVENNFHYSRRIKFFYVPQWLHEKNNDVLTDEYIRISSNNDLKHNSLISKELSSLVYKIRVFQLILSYLKAVDTLEVLGKSVNDTIAMDYLKANRLRIKPFTRERAILVLDNEIKTAYITYEAKKKQYKENKSEQKISRDDFSKWIAVLNYNKFNVDYKMSVADYIQRINMYQKMCEDLKNYGK